MATDTISFEDLYNEITLGFSILPTRSEVRATLNAVIHQINSRMDMHQEVIQIASDMIYAWEDLTAANLIDNWEDLTAANDYNSWENWGRFIQGYEFDITQYRLIIPKNIQKIDELYVDDEKWTNVSYEVLNDSDNSTENYYSQMGRYVYFSSDISTDTEIIKIKIRTLYDDITGDYTVLPYIYHQLLISGAIYLLTLRPIYSNEGLNKQHKEVYYIELNSVKDKEDGLNINREFDFDHSYGGHEWL